MKKLYFSITLLLAYTFFSCQKQEPAVDVAHLPGTWHGSYYEELYQNDSLTLEEGFKGFTLVLNEDGSGTYDIQNSGTLADIIWSRSFDHSFIFLSLINDFDPPDYTYTEYRFEVVEDEEEHQLWRTTQQLTNNNNTVRYIYWELNKQ